MKVITFNLRCADDADGHSVAERSPRLKQILQRYDADLMGFQEVTHRWWEIIHKDYADEYEIYGVFRDTSPWAEAEPLLWKKGAFELLDSGTFWFSDTPHIMSRGWDSMGCYRCCSWVKLLEKKSGVDFLWFNCHYGFSDPCQMQSTQLALNHLKEVKPNALIFTGDFNMYPHYPAYRCMTQVLADANALTANDWGNTFHGYKGTPGKNHIDYCFVTPETAVPTASHVIRDTVDGKYPSDHYGVLTEITLRSRHKVYSLTVDEESMEEEPRLERARRLRSRLLNAGPSLIALRGVGETFLGRLERLDGYGPYQVLAEEGDLLAWKRDLCRLISRERFATADGTKVLCAHMEGPAPFVLYSAHLNGSDPLQAAQAIGEAAKAKGLPAVIAVSGIPVGSPAHSFLQEQAVDARCLHMPDNTPTLQNFDAKDQASLVESHHFFLGVENIFGYAVDRRTKMAPPCARDGLMTQFSL